jgi:hypothetical protein
VVGDGDGGARFVQRPTLGGINNEVAVMAVIASGASVRKDVHAQLQGLVAIPK